MAHNHLRRLAPLWTLLTIFVVASGAAAGAAWFRLRSNKRPVAFFGRDTARLILLAPTAWAERQNPGEPLVRVDVSQAPGFSHVRRSLLSDKSFDWQAAAKVPPADRPVWSLTFSEGRDAATVRLFLDDGVLATASRDQAANIQPAVSALTAFFADVAARHEAAETPQEAPPATIR